MSKSCPGCGRAMNECPKCEGKGEVDKGAFYYMHMVKCTHCSGVGYICKKCD